MLLAADGRALLLTAQASVKMAGVRGDAVSVVMASAVGLVVRLCAAKTTTSSWTSRLTTIGG